MFDLVIKNATIIDGAKTPRYRGDIGVRAGRIAKIGAIDDTAGAEVLDAEGRIVAPGFVDPHTHYDAQLFWDPTCSDSGPNGATTVIAGNCGFGFAPCKPENRHRYMLMMQHTEQIAMKQMEEGLPWSWESYPEFLDAVDGLPKAVNVSLYMPLNPLLIYVMGIDAAKSRRPNRAEMARIKALLHEGMDAGAQGVSFVRLGTIDSHTDYDGSAMPTDLMDPDDCAEIASVIGERGEGVVMCTSQVGQMGDPIVSEKVARATAGRPVIHNVAMTSEETPDLHRRALEWLERVRGEGLNVWAQAVLGRSWQEFNAWHLEGSTLDFMPVAREFTGLRDFDQKMAKAADRDYRQRFRDGYDPRAFEVLGGPVSDYVVVSMGKNGDPAGCAGRSFGDIGKERGVDFVDAFFDLAIESEMDFTFKKPRGPSIDPLKVHELLVDEHALAGVSDGGAHSKFTSSGVWPTDILIWIVRENGLMALEDMHYKLSGLPCEVFGLKDRGVLKEGAFADLVVYRLDELHFDLSGYDVAHDMAGGDWRRKVRSGGYRWIIVNGQVTYERDVRREATPGVLLRIGQPRGDVHRAAAE
jgi:N-acyl-D-aspartate/D-glutamate deacylase